MTKRELVMKISDESGIRQSDVKKVVQKFLDHIIEALVKGDTLELRNFGVFKVKSRKPRIGRNPKTGVAVNIPAKKKVIFKAGMVMKKKVR